MDWEILYYSNEVQETIDAWPVGIRAYYARITERMCTFGPNLGMPFADSLGQGLFEIRARGKEGIGRACFCTLVERKILIVHAYIKKSQQTPARELEVACKRLAEVQRRGEQWEH
jgi:phage-related protein